MKGRDLYERERDSLLELIEQNSDWCSSKKEYNAKIITAGEQVEVQLYETWPTNSANKGRAVKISRPAQDKLNRKYKQQRLARLINTNFTEQGTWLTLTPRIS